jgi:hypothetical protein
MTTRAHGQRMKVPGRTTPAAVDTNMPTLRQEGPMPRTLPALLGPVAAFLALVALLALSLRALAALITARVTGRPLPPVASPALLAIFALAALPHDRAPMPRAGPTRAADAPPLSECITRGLWLALLLEAAALLVLAALALLPAAPPALPFGLLALVALPHGADHGDRAHGERADTRRGRFIPPASRAAMDEMASDIRKMRLRRYGMAAYPSYGKLDAAWHALLTIIPYPSDPEERELMEDALRWLEERAPDVARPLAERMRAHYLRQAEGGARRGA